MVNAGPAVFISPTGPNPIMVQVIFYTLNQMIQTLFRSSSICTDQNRITFGQPLPFQSGMSLGAIPMGAVQPGSGLINGLGSGFLPRRIDIQIRRGTFYIYLMFCLVLV